MPKREISNPLEVMAAPSKKPKLEDLVKRLIEASRAQTPDQESILIHHGDKILTLTSNLDDQPVDVYGELKLYKYPDIADVNLADRWRHVHTHLKLYLQDDSPELKMLENVTTTAISRLQELDDTVVALKKTYPKK